MKLIVYIRTSSAPCYHRVIQPIMAMEGRDVLFTNEFLETNYENPPDIVIYNRTIGTEYLKKIQDLRKKHGFKIIVDVDDIWHLDSHHIMYKSYIDNDFAKHQINQIRDADAVTTTHERLAKYIEQFNENVYVLPNAIRRTGQYDIIREESKFIRLFWQGSITHKEDLRLLERPLEAIGNISDKVKMILGGYTRYEENDTPKSAAERNDEKEWNEMAKIYTANAKHQYKLIAPEPVTNYYSMYKHADICLIPLVNSFFNRMKCVVGDSLVATTTGVKKIRDIVESKMPCQVDLDGIHNVVNYFKYESEQTIKIVTEFGYEIEGTPTHRIKINDKWVTLGELAVGDKVELMGFNISSEKYQQLSYPMLLSKTITERTLAESDENMLPKITINERWGRFFGYMLGDGHYSGNGISISCDKRHADIVEDVKELYASMGLMPQIVNKTPDKRCLNNLSKEGFGVDIKAASRNLLELCKKYGVVSDKGKTFAIPEFILNSPRRVVKEFLRGLFEADGSLGSCKVTLCTKSIYLAKQVQVLLLAFGIKSNIIHSYNKHYRRYYYNLAIGRDGSDIFKEEINFISKNKRDRLSEICSKDHSNAFKKQVFSDTIKEITCGVNDVFDIEVEDAHCYVANGILNHNSNLKVLEAANLALPCIASDVHPYKDLPIRYCRNSTDWINHISELVKYPDRRTDDGLALADFVNEKFNFNKINAERKQIFESVIKQTV